MNNKTMKRWAKTGQQGNHSPEQNWKLNNLLYEAIVSSKGQDFIS